MLYTDCAVYLGIVYSYLPFMILPLYSTLAKMDAGAARGGGRSRRSPRQAFLLVTLPLSLPGIVAGACCASFPIVGEFVIPDLLGGPDTLMIGQSLWTSSSPTATGRWPSRRAVVLLLLLVCRCCIYEPCSAAQLEAR